MHLAETHLMVMNKQSDWHNAFNMLPTGMVAAKAAAEVYEQVMKGRDMTLHVAITPGNGP